MSIIKSKIDPNSDNYRSNYSHNEKLAIELSKTKKTISEMGSSQNIEKHTAQGKLTVRERIEKLKDKGSKFLEFSDLAGYKVYDDYVPAAGIITGLITIMDRPCIIVANDATVKGLSLIHI